MVNIQARIGQHIIPPAKANWSTTCKFNIWTTYLFWLSSFKRCFILQLWYVILAFAFKERRWGNSIMQISLLVLFIPSCSHTNNCCWKNKRLTKLWMFRKKDSKVKKVICWSMPCNTHQDLKRLCAHYLDFQNLLFPCAACFIMLFFLIYHHTHLNRKHCFTWRIYIECWKC